MTKKLFFFRLRKVVYKGIEKEDMAEKIECGGMVGNSCTCLLTESPFIEHPFSILFPVVQSHQPQVRSNTQTLSGPEFRYLKSLTSHHQGWEYNK